MKKNVGTVDSMIRYVVAAALVVVGLFVLKGIQGNLTGVIVAAAAIVPALTATVKSCPLYTIVGLNTAEKK